MNRTGLIIALAIGAAGGLLFGFFPEIDLKFAALFFDPATKRFISTSWPSLLVVRDTAMWLIAALMVPPLVALSIKTVLPRRRLLIPSRIIPFMLATIILAPGIMANVVLKDHWGRSRPIDVPQFGGEERFTPWWDPRGPCDKNCSFVSGDISGAFWTIAPASIAPPAWRPLAYGAAITFGVAVSFLRFAFGAHFLSDALFAGVFSFLIIWTVHGIIFRWRLTRLTEEGLEYAMEWTALLPYTLARWLRAKWRG